MPLINVITFKPRPCVFTCPTQLDAYNIMGQEDIYRQENGIRVFNYLLGRVVVTLNAPARINVHYSPGTELLNLQTGWTATEEFSHEIFFVLTAPNTLYAFKVEAISETCELSTESEIYYFVTDPEIHLGTSNITITDGFELNVNFVLLEQEVTTSSSFEVQVLTPNNAAFVDQQTITADHTTNPDDEEIFHEMTVESELSIIGPF